MNRLLFGNVVLLVFLGVFPDPAQAQESGNFSCLLRAKMRFPHFARRPLQKSRRQRANLYKSA